MTDAQGAMWIADIHPEGTLWHKAFPERPGYYTNQYNEYIRADQAEANKRAAAEAMREECAKLIEESDLPTRSYIAAAIRAVPIHRVIPIPG